MRERDKLIRAVGFWGLVAMCINGVVGSGVFLLPSESFAILGPFSLWAPLIFAVPVFILVLCFAEASSYFSEPGGAYLYTRTAFGDFLGFETGWMNTLARITSLASLSNGFVVTLARLYPEAGVGTTRAVIIAATLLGFALLHASGIRYGARTIYFFTAGKLIPLIGFIVVALIAFRYNPIPASFTIPTGDVRWSDAALLLLFAYAGFENLGIPAGEFKNPKRDLPRALLTGICAIGVIYVLAQLAAMSALPDLSSTKTPIADGAGALLGSTGATIVTIGAILSILGTNLGTMLEASRMVFTLGEDRPPYTFFGRVNDRFRTPVNALMLLTVAAIPIAIAGSFAKLAMFSALARLTTYLFTSAAIPFLRKKREGTFRTPGGLLFPILGTLISLSLFVTVDAPKLIGAAVALLVGAVLWGIGRAAAGRQVTA